jgi:histidinol-phosphate/aromatic aminotransferase/cobyric acid decarboxylase-like protein
MWHLVHPVRHSFHSLGVRDSLRVLLDWLAGQGRSIALPCDIYPVYRQIADMVGVTFSTYPTLLAFDIAAALTSADDALLVTAPLSPLDRDLTGEEVAALTEDISRLLVTTWRTVTYSHCIF